MAVSVITWKLFWLRHIVWCTPVHNYVCIYKNWFPVIIFFGLSALMMIEVIYTWIWKFLFVYILCSCAFSFCVLSCVFHRKDYTVFYCFFLCKMMVLFFFLFLNLNILLILVSDGKDIDLLFSSYKQLYSHAYSYISYILGA